MKINCTACVLLCALFWACGISDSLTADELVRYVADPENGLIREVDIDDLHMAAIYRPTDLLVYNEVGNNPATAEQTGAAYRKYTPFYYFVLTLSRDNKEILSPASVGEQYSDLVQTLSFRMNDYVSLTTSSQDTIPVGDFMLMRSYGLGCATELLFAFAKEKSKGSDWVQVNVKEFGLGSGIQRFRFKVHDLEETPVMRFREGD